MQNRFRSLIWIAVVHSSLSVQPAFSQDESVAYDRMQQECRAQLTPLLSLPPEEAIKTYHDMLGKIDPYCAITEESVQLLTQGALISDAGANVAIDIVATQIVSMLAQASACTDRLPTDEIYTEAERNLSTAAYFVQALVETTNGPLRLEREERRSALADALLRKLDRLEDLVEPLGPLACEKPNLDQLRTNFTRELLCANLPADWMTRAVLAFM